MKVPLLLILLVPGVIFTNIAQVIPTHFPKRQVVVKTFAPKKNVWVFLLAGQSNMAGRGLVEPADTVPDNRIWTINKENVAVLAKEPLHYYEPNLTGLDCGLAFGKALLKSIPDNVIILVVPVAVGGSSIQQWLGDSTWREVKLLSNAKEKISVAKKIGTFKGILWHQGESNANTLSDIEQHSARLSVLTKTFRSLIGDPKLPFLMGELGSFSKNADNFSKLNQQLLLYSQTDRYSALIQISDLAHKGDFLHFNSAAQRAMGERFAQAYVSKFLSIFLKK